MRTEPTSALVIEEPGGLEFEPFFEAEYPRLVRTMYLLTADAAEAEDLAQESLAVAYERWPKIRAMASPGGYVYQTALNRYRKRLRGRRLQLRWAVRERPLDPIAVADTRTGIARALLSLPPGQREAVVLVEWLGLTSAEAAGLLGIEPSSVRSRVHRANEPLRELLEVTDA